MKRLTGFINQNIVLCLGILLVISFSASGRIFDKQLTTGGDVGEWIRDVERRNTVRTIFDYRLQTGSKATNSYYCPMQSLLWLWVVRTFEKNATGYYAVSFLIHYLNTLIVFFIARFLMKKNSYALLAGSLFTVFRPNIHTIGWLSASFTHAFATLFILLTVFLHMLSLEKKEKRLYTGSVIVYGLALLTKESSFSLLFILIAYHWLFHCESLKNPREYILRYLPFVLLLLLVLLIAREKYPHGNVNKTWGGVEVGAWSVYRFFDFLSVLIFPARCFPIIKMTLVAIVFMFSVHVFLKGDKKIIFSLVWISLATAPFCISNFRPILSITRYLYPVSAAYGLLLSGILFHARENKLRLQKRSITIFIAAFLISHFLVLSGLSFPKKSRQTSRPKVVANAEK